MSNVLAIIKQSAVETFPNTPRYKARFLVRSSSSNKNYMVSYDAAPGAGYWTCSCRGNIAHGQCKHLSVIGLKGRKYGHNLLSKQEVEQLNQLGQ